MSPEPLKTGRDPTSCAVGPERSRARSPRGPLLASALLFVAAAPALDDWTQRRLAAHPPPAILDHPLWLLAKPEILLGLLGASAGLAKLAARRPRPQASKFGAEAPVLDRLLATGLFALGASLVLKLMIGRARPGGADADPMAFAPGAFDRAFQSLPSSSSAVAAALALTLVRWRPSLSLPALAALVVICAERIFSRSHWPSDVVAGVVVGLLVVKLTDTRDLGGAR